MSNEIQFHANGSLPEFQPLVNYLRDDSLFEADIPTFGFVIVTLLSEILSACLRSNKLCPYFNLVI